MKQYVLIIVMSFLAGSMAARANDRYTVHLTHANGLHVVRVDSPDGMVSSTITSLSVRTGDQITFEIDNPFTPLWKYSTDVTDTPFKLSESEREAIEKLRDLVKKLPGGGSLAAKQTDSLRLSEYLESTWTRLLARLDSIPIIRSEYEALREQGNRGLSKKFYELISARIASARDTLAALDNRIDRLGADEPSKKFFKWVNRVLTAHVSAIEAEMRSTTCPTKWDVVADGDERVVNIYARNRKDTMQVETIQLRLKISYPRPAFSLDPTLAMLILQSGLYEYKVATDSSGKARLADSTAKTGVAIRPAVQFTFWPWSFGQRSDWALGPSVYFGYAHDFVFDIGATLTLAYRNVAQVSIGYVSASMPQSVSGQIQADTPIPENAVLSYRRVPSMVICLSIQGLAL